MTLDPQRMVPEFDGRASACSMLEPCASWEGLEQRLRFRSREPTGAEHYNPLVSDSDEPGLVRDDEQFDKTIEARKPPKSFEAPREAAFSGESKLHLLAVLEMRLTVRDQVLS